MKMKMIVIIALCIVIPSAPLYATDGAKANDQSKVLGRLFLILRTRVPPST